MTEQDTFLASDMHLIFTANLYIYNAAMLSRAIASLSWLPGLPGLSAAIIRASSTLQHFKLTSYLGFGCRCGYTNGVKMLVYQFGKIM